MDTESCIVYIKTEEIYIEIAKNVKSRLVTLNQEIEKPLPKKRKLKKVNGYMKDKIVEKRMRYGDGDENKKQNAQKVYHKMKTLTVQKIHEFFG